MDCSFSKAAFAKEPREIIATVPGAMEAGLKSTNLPSNFNHWWYRAKGLTGVIKKGDVMRHSLPLARIKMGSLPWHWQCSDGDASSD